MSFQPVIPAGGNLGWTFLKTSRHDQQAAFDKSPAMRTFAEHFRQQIGTVRSAEDLVADRRLLTVALGAFGLDDDIGNKFFIRKVLEEGTLTDDAFANRLSDKRYRAMSEAFGFHLQPPNTVLSDFGDRIVRQYQDRQFEVAVGNQDENLRMALGVEREIGDLASRSLAEDAAWFTVMGNPPLRRVFEGALGLPTQLAAIDIDQQLSVFRDKAAAVFGTTDPTDFQAADLQEKLVRSFLFRADLEANARNTSAATVALSLLQTLQPAR